MKDKPRISVNIITYKQEDVIRRTLDSLMSQECLYEICVSDDCSPDGTWDILQEYSERYPGIFKLHRNDPNIGIFANEEQTWKMPTGDLVFRMAGDDECCEGYFGKVVEFIETTGINWKEDLFAVVGETVTVYPDGNTYTSSNRLVEKGISPLKLKMRGLLDDRSACFSRKLLDRYIPVSNKRSFVVEEAQDDQLEIFADKFYHINATGCKYYAESGISSRLTAEDKLERVDIYNYFLSFITGLGIKLDRSDRYYLKYRTKYLTFSATGSKKALLQALLYSLCSLDIRLGVHGLDLAHLVNALKRKLKRNNS